MSEDGQQKFTPPGSPAASHMLWFFLLPAFLFLGWASYQLVSGMGKHKPATTLVQKAHSIEGGRSDGDRWKAAYSFAEELLKRSKDGTYQAIPLADRKEIISALSSLMVRFKDDLRLRKYLILTLGRLNDPETLPLIKMTLKDPDADLRFYSAWGYLGTLVANPQQVKPADLVEVRSWLKSQDTAFQKIATTFLVQNDPEGASEVIPLLNDKDKEVRWNAGVALGAIGRAEGAATLKEIFTLTQLRDFGFRSAKDMEQLLKSARVASAKLADPGVNENIKTLRAAADASTPEGRAIKAALD